MAKVSQLQNVEVPVSGETEIYLPGHKCAHGVYIPSSADDQRKAHYCFTCNQNFCDRGKEKMNGTLSR